MGSLTLKIKSPGINDLLSLKELEVESLKGKVKTLLLETEELRKKSKEYLTLEKKINKEDKDVYLNFLQEFDILENDKAEIISEIKKDLVSLKTNIYTTSKIQHLIDKIIKKLESYQE